MPAESASIETAALAMLLAFVLSQVIAWVYIYTHAGLSYSRAFVQSIILLSVIISVSMMVIGNSLAIAFGLIGALSVIRFRNVLKDTRDTSFIFAALVVVWWLIYSKRCPKCKKGRALEKTEVRDQWKCKYCGHSEVRGYDIGEKG